MPHLTLSPNEAYEEAVARAGFVYVPRDPDLYLGLLPVEARVIGRADVEIAGLTYDSPALDHYRQTRSPLSALDGKWPIRIDRRDLGRVWSVRRFRAHLCEAAVGRGGDAAPKRGGDRHRAGQAAA